MDDAWRLIPLGDAQPQLPSADVRARSWWRDVLSRLHLASGQVDDPTPADDRLDQVGEARLARLVPDPPRDAQRAALRDYRRQRAHGLLLRPDDGAWDAVLDATDADLEADDGVTTLGPPDGVGLGLTLPASAIACLDADGVLHVPHLERWWVRHHDGLGAIRELLWRLGARAGPWSADIAPWAWAWMRAVLPEARGLPAPWVAAPLDGDALQAWLGDVETLRLRGSGDPPDETTYRSLAVRSRGEAGVAAAIWRACVRDGAERQDDDAPDDEEQGHAPRGIVWLRHPKSVDLPQSSTLSRPDLLLLHAVLLHGSATTAVVAAAVGMDVHQVSVVRRLFEAQGLLDVDDEDRLRVAPLALPGLRSRLQSEGFAVESP